MKKSFVIIFLTIVTLSVKSSIAQTRFPSLSVGKIASINQYLSKFYKPDTAFVNHVCLNTIVFIRFKVDNDKINLLGFSSNCPAQIKEGLIKAMLTTNTYFKSTDVEKETMKDKIFLLSVILYYQLGCSPSQIVQKESDRPKDPMAELMKYASRDDQLHKSIDNMLSFDDGKSFTSLDCVLINPVRFSAFD